MLCRSASPRTEVQADVFTLISSHDHVAAGVMGGCVSACALRSASLLQFLVGLTVADDPPLLGAGQLSATLSRACLPANSFSVDVDCGPRYDLFPAAGLSPGLLPFVPCGREKRSLLSVGGHSVVGQLPGSRLRLEDNPGKRRHAQHFVAVRPPYKTSVGVSTLQPIRGGAHAHPHLHAVCIFANLCGARTHSSQSGGGIP